MVHTSNFLKMRTVTAVATEKHFVSLPETTHEHHNVESRSNKPLPEKWRAGAQANVKPLKENSSPIDAP